MNRGATKVSGHLKLESRVVLFFLASCLFISLIAIPLLNLSYNGGFIFVLVLLGYTFSDAIEGHESKDREMLRHSPIRAAEIKKCIYCELSSLTREIATALQLCQFQISEQNVDSAAAILQKLKKTVLRSNLKLRQCISAVKRKKLLSENVRMEITQVLHDVVIQQLSAILIGIQHCEKLLSIDHEKALQQIGTVLNLAVGFETKEILSYSLLEHDRREIDQLKLTSAVECCLSTFRKISDIQFDLSVYGSESNTCLFLKTKFLRIIQEALFNVCKHAQASKVKVKIGFERDRIEAAIEDNGKGFLLSSGLSKSKSLGHLGLFEMYEEARSLNGSLNIDTAPGQGTIIALDIPQKRV